MSYRFGSRSRGRLSTCHPKLQVILARAMSYQIMDFTIVCGHRNEADQNEAHAIGASTKKWPNSNHNDFPSNAVDVAPWPIDWNDHLAFSRLAGIIEAAAAETGTLLRWGGDWDRDGGSRDQSFMDIGHLEIKE